MASHQTTWLLCYVNLNPNTFVSEDGNFGESSDGDNKALVLHKAHLHFLFAKVSIRLTSEMKQPQHFHQQSSNTVSHFGKKKKIISYLRGNKLSKPNFAPFLRKQMMTAMLL